MERSRAEAPRSVRSLRRRDDRGSQFVEFGAFFPLLLIIGVITLELFASFLALERLSNAARNGARVAAEQGTQAGTQAARDSLPSWLDHAEVVSGHNDGSFYVEASASPPFVFPAADLEFEVVRRVHMPGL